MPSYDVNIPGQGTFRVDSPTPLSDYQAYQHVLAQMPAPTPEVKPESGILAGLKRGVLNPLSSIRTGIESLLPEENAPENAALKGLQRQEDIAKKYESVTNPEKVKQAYEKSGLLSAAGEFLSQVPGTIAEQAPQFAASSLSGRLGSALGAIGGVRGKLFGEVVGRAVPFVAQALGSHVERQAQEDIKAGRPVDIDLASAAGWAIPSGMFDTVASKITLGGAGVIGKALNIETGALAKMSTAKVERLAQEKLIPAILKGTATGIAAELPTEIAQQMIERYQAGLPLTSPDAIAEYGSVAYQVSLMGPLGVAGRLSERGAARTELAGREAADAAILADQQKQEAMQAPQPVAPSPTMVPVTPGPTPTTQENLFTPEEIPTQLSPDVLEAQTAKGKPLEVPAPQAEERAQSELLRNIDALTQQGTPEALAQAEQLKAQLPEAPETRATDLGNEMMTLERKYKALETIREGTKKLDEKNVLTQQMNQIRDRQNEILQEGKKLQKEGVSFEAPPEQMGLNLENVVTEDDFKTMGIGRTNKNLREAILGKSLSDPKERQFVIDALNAYAEDKNRSASISERVGKFVDEIKKGAPSGTVPEVGARASQPSVPVLGGQFEPAGRTTAPTTAGLDGTEPTTGRPVAGEGAPGETGQGTLRFRQAGEKSTGLSISDVQGLVNRIVEKWKNSPIIQVVQSVNQLPQAIQTQIERENVQRPQGVWDEDTQAVYLIADNLPDGKQVGLTVAHEALGHYGLRTILGDNYSKVMNDAYRNDEVKRRADNKIDRGMAKETAVEEVLAEMAEKGEEPSLLNRIVNIIRNALRAIGIDLKGTTNSEILQLLADSRQYVIEGKGEAGKGGMKVGKVFSGDAPIFYSKLAAMTQHAPKNLREGATGKQWADWINSNAGKFGVKKEEVEWSGVNDLLNLMDKNIKITSKSVTDLLNETGVKVGEELYGGARSKESELEAFRFAADLRGTLRQQLKEVVNKYNPEEIFTQGFIDSVARRSPGRKFDKAEAYGTLATSTADELKYAFLRDTTGWAVMQTEDFESYGIYDKNLDNVYDYNFDAADEARAELNKARLESSKRNTTFDPEVIFSLKNLYDEANNKAIENQNKKPTRFDTWKTHGGENYGELVLTLPKSTSWFEHAGHWPGVYNPIAHARFSEFTDEDGKRVLLVDEVQSDWGQAGTKHGFGAQEEHRKKLQDLLAKHKAITDKLTAAVDTAIAEGRMRDIFDLYPEDLKPLDAEHKKLTDEIIDLRNSSGKAPPKAPFVQDTKSWTTLMVKRILRYAADREVDRIAFIDGQTAFERFPRDQDGNSTEKGMKTYYDQILPSVVKDVLHKLGADAKLQSKSLSTQPKTFDNIEYFYNVRSFGNITTYGPYESRVEMYANMLERSEWTESGYNPQKFTEDIINPNTQEVIFPKGSDVYLGKLMRMDDLGYDLAEVFKTMLTRPVNFTETSQIKNVDDKHFLTIDLAPETAEKVKEGQAMFRAATPEGAQAEQDMAAFGGRAEQKQKSFVEKNRDSFQKVANDWRASAERNDSKVAATFGKFQNIASFDQAFNNRLYNHFMGLKNQGVITLEEAKQALLRVSTSQALHRTNLANQIIDRGNYTYDVDSNRWYAVDDPINMGKFEEIINNVANRLGVEPTRARQIVGAAYEANRLSSLYNTLRTAEKELATAEKDILKIKDAKQRATKKELIKALEEKVEEFTGKVQHKTPEQVAAGMRLYNSIPEIKEGTDIWNTMRERVVKMLVDTGVKTQEQAEAWLDEAAYVPFFRDIEEEKSVGPNVMTGGLRESMGDKQMRGSMKEVHDPIENMYKWMQWSIARAVSNKQLNVMLDQYKAALPDEVREGKGADSNTFTVYRDGKLRFYNVADPAIAQAFVGLEPIIFPGISWLTGSSNFLRHAVTRNPLFSASQLFMDSYTAMFTSGLKSPFGVLKEIAKEVAATAQGTSATRTNLMKAGILETHDYAALTEADAIGKRLGLEKPGAWAKLAQRLDHLAATSDNVIRQGVYNQAIKEGLSHNEAMEKAAELVNFRRVSGDPRIQFLSRIVPFFNAYLQVSSVAVKTLTGRGISPQERDAAAKVLMATTAKIAMISMLYSMAVGDDEDYKKKNRITRDRMWMIPGTGGLGIPVRTDVFALPKVIGEYSYHLIADKGYTDSKMVKEALSRAVLGSLSVPSEGIPQFVRPTLGVMTNYDFFQKREIVNATMRKLDVSEQYTKNTSEMAKAFSSILGKLGVEASPLNIDYLVKGYLGTAGTLTALATNDIIASASGRQRPSMSAQDLLASVPNASAFVSREENTAVLSDFYEAARDINKVVATTNHLRPNNPEGMRKYMEEHKKEYQLKGMTQAINNQLVVIKRQEMRIRESNKSSEQKQAELKALDNRRDQLTAQVQRLRQKLYE